MGRIIEITDFLDPELDVYARLSEAQLLNREFPEKGLFIAESPKVIERALDAGYEPVSCLMENRHIEGEGKQILARMKDIPVFCAEFDVLTQLTGFKLTRGMLCAMKRKPLPALKEICRNKSRINPEYKRKAALLFGSAAFLCLQISVWGDFYEKST